MAKVIEFDKNGNILYRGMLTANEIASYDDVINALKEEIPQIEKELKQKYSDNKGRTTIEYKYFLGKALSQYINRFDVSFVERRRFWDEIKNLASTEERKRDEGKKSARRSFFEQCYILSMIEHDTVVKFSWKRWQDLLDRDVNSQDKRIFDWIGKNAERITQSDWAEFEKALNLYLKNKDTSVFSGEELYEIYDINLQIAGYWNKFFKSFKKEHPDSAKIKKKSMYSKKYYAECFEYMKKSRKHTIDEVTCLSIFNGIMESGFTK